MKHSRTDGHYNPPCSEVANTTTEVDCQLPEGLQQIYLLSAIRHVSGAPLIVFFNDETEACLAFGYILDNPSDWYMYGLVYYEDQVTGIVYNIATCRPIADGFYISLGEGYYLVEVSGGIIMPYVCPSTTTTTTEELVTTTSPEPQ
jgi:hypothetical protein